MRGLPSILAVLVTSAPIPANADVFKLYAEAHGGGMVGKGLGGDVIDNASLNGSFFESASPGAFGALIGGRFLFLDVQIQHHQFVGGGDLSTWTQFGAGLEFEAGLGQTPEQKKAGKGGYVAIGTHLFFGVGTGQQVMPPLSNDEVTDKGFLLQGALGFGKRLNKVFDIGISIPVSYGYFFKSGDALAANNLETHYQSLQVEGLLVLRANIRLF
jgi:hypothetical protein